MTGFGFYCLIFCSYCLEAKIAQVHNNEWWIGLIQVFWYNQLWCTYIKVYKPSPLPVL